VGQRFERRPACCSEQHWLRLFLDHLADSAAIDTNSLGIIKIVVVFLLVADRR